MDFVVLRFWFDSIYSTLLVSRRSIELCRRWWTSRTIQMGHTATAPVIFCHSNGKRYFRMRMFIVDECVSLTHIRNVFECKWKTKGCRASQQFTACRLLLVDVHRFSVWIRMCIVSSIYCLFAQHTNAFANESNHFLQSIFINKMKYFSFFFFFLHFSCVLSLMKLFSFFVFVFLFSIFMVRPSTTCMKKLHKNVFRTTEKERGRERRNIKREEIFAKMISSTFCFVWMWMTFGYIFNDTIRVRCYCLILAGWLLLTFNCTQLFNKFMNLFLHGDVNAPTEQTPKWRWNTNGKCIEMNQIQQQQQRNRFTYAQPIWAIGMAMNKWSDVTHEISLEFRVTHTHTHYFALDRSA